MDPRDHHLFRTYPLNGTATISTGVVPTPYHIYDGYGLFIGGVSDREAVHHLLRDERVTPISTSDGKVVTGIWVCNFSAASLGPHHELQVSFFVGEQDTHPIPAHPLNALALMLTRPDVRMLCFGLWNNTPAVVAYNRELLSLNARLAESRIERGERQVSFQFTDSATNQPIVSGNLHNHRRASLSASAALIARLGVRSMLALARQPWLRMQILNPLGVGLNRNASATALAKPDSTLVRYVDQRTDTLTFGAPAYAALQFTPSCLEYMDGFKFVYLQPE